MTELPSIDVGSALPYFEDKLAALFGKDALHRDAARLVARLNRLAVRDASNLQIVGMDRPVAIADIYQPLQLRRQWRDGTCTLESLVQRGTSALISGLPGAGKSSLLHFAFTQLSGGQSRLPLLFTLRRAGAVGDLLALLEHMIEYRIPKKKSVTAVLLVDGLDEVGGDDRTRVTEALRDYQSLGVGPFYVTCRSYYPVDDLGAEHYELTAFTRPDSERFVTAFASAYGVKIEAATLLDDLTDRGFGDFIAHPLMLALVCILRAGPVPTLPRSPIGLLRRAVDTLTFRWDEAKGISRDTSLPIDGDDRVRCMMNVAYYIAGYEASDAVVRRIVGDYLKQQHRPEISPDRLLVEIAQWYGMLIPAASGVWTFAHRVIHDYMAARYWVESGKFSPRTVLKWNARAAYAAALTDSATEFILRVLNESDDIAVFVECLYNNARFLVDDVSDALLAHFERTKSYTVEAVDGSFRCHTKNDFMKIAPRDLLITLARKATACAQGQTAATALLAYALVELAAREEEIPDVVVNRATAALGHGCMLVAVRGDVGICFSLTDGRLTSR